MLLQQSIQLSPFDLVPLIHLVYSLLATAVQPGFSPCLNSGEVGTSGCYPPSLFVAVIGARKKKASR